LGQAVAEERGLMFYYQDVTNETQWSEVMNRIAHDIGTPTILVNNAGVLGPSDALDLGSISLKIWRFVFSVNVEAVFLGCRAGVESMKVAGGGSIINMASIAGLMATPYAMAYGASKAAVQQMTRSVAQYCAERRLNIRCNSVHPGTVRTPLWDAHAQVAADRRRVPLEQVVTECGLAIPLERLTLPAEIAAAVAFLASDDARNITGTQLIIDGGLTGCDTFESRVELDGDATVK
jgi:NAD(P)-dependent dehydrogenase (short-subunit alcohol dehydrogenase family)